MSDKSVLWLDNDLFFINPYKEKLEETGYCVSVVKKVSDAEKLLRSRRFDLFILDVMIPTLNDAEEVDYPPSDTDNGHKTGLLFYLRLKEHLVTAGTPVLVFSVLIDRQIQTAFVENGLPAENFVPKMDVKLVADFSRVVERVMLAVTVLQSNAQVGAK